MRGPLGTPLVADTRRSYDDAHRRRWHHGIDGRWVLVAAVHVLGVVIGARADVGHLSRIVGAAMVLGVAASCAGWLVSNSRAVTACVGLVACLGVAQGAAAWRAVAPDRLGPWSGWAVVVADPVPRGRAILVTLEVDRERFDAAAYGGSARRLARVAAGEFVRVAGRRVALGAGAVRRAAVRHVVGRFEIDRLGDVRSGTALSTAANRVRRTLRAAADDTMAIDEAALFSGLVIGDDARQSPAMVDRFRVVGLSHLTAVSGQNVAFVLAAAAPLLHRLAPRRRWMASLGLIAWFMVLTRFEPSVLRAGLMAMLSATAFVAGRPAPPVRLLAICVAVLTTIDPLLVWSVGFWLSVSATIGVAVVAPVLERLLPGPTWCSRALGVTLGAQVGVALPSLLVFGRLPIVALLANPAAVPVAGAVMLVGVPSALVAAVLAAAGLDGVAGAVMAPSRLGTRWVDQVSRVAVELEPPAPVAWACWVVLTVLLAVWWWRNRVVCPTDVPI